MPIFLLASLMVAPLIQQDFSFTELVDDLFW